VSSVDSRVKFYSGGLLLKACCVFVGLKMTQFSFSSTNDHLEKSHQKASRILDGNGVKSKGLSSKVFYGNNAPYML
jgi:hypothetical protein